MILKNLRLVHFASWEGSRVFVTAKMFYDILETAKFVSEFSVTAISFFWQQNLCKIFGDSNFVLLVAKV